MNEAGHSQQLRNIDEVDVGGIRRLDVSNLNRLVTVLEAEIPDFKSLITEAILSSKRRMASESDLFEAIISRYHFSVPIRTAHFHFCTALSDMVDSGEIRQSQEKGFEGLYLLVQKSSGSEATIRVYVPKNDSKSDPSEHYLGMVRRTIQALDEGNGASRRAMMDYISKHYQFEEKNQLYEQFDLSLGRLIRQGLIECICGDKYTYVEEVRTKRMKKSAK